MKSEMRIQAIVATEVRVPFRQGYVDSPIHGDPAWKHSPKWILEIGFDNGIVGLGETQRATAWNDVESFSKYLVGKRLAELCLQRFFVPQELQNDMIAPASSKVPSRSWEYEYAR